MGLEDAVPADNRHRILMDYRVGFAGTKFRACGLLMSVRVSALPQLRSPSGRMPAFCRRKIGRAFPYQSTQEATQAFRPSRTSGLEASSPRSANFSAARRRKMIAADESNSCG